MFDINKLRSVFGEMSKMRMPEMSVVRFEESDVICASSPMPEGTRLMVANFGNDEDNDGWIYSGNNVIYRNSIQNPINRLTKYFPDYNDEDLTFWWGDRTGHASMRGMMEDDAPSGVYVDSAVNGEYVYNGDGTFSHQ